MFDYVYERRKHKNPGLRNWKFLVLILNQLVLVIEERYVIVTIYITRRTINIKSRGLLLSFYVFNYIYYLKL
jgi:hypothetical protein